MPTLTTPDVLDIVSGATCGNSNDSGKFTVWRRHFCHP